MLAISTWSVPSKSLVTEGKYRFEFLGHNEQTHFTIMQMYDLGGISQTTKTSVAVKRAVWDKKLMWEREVQ